MPRWPSAAPSGGTTVPDPTSPHQRLAVTAQDSHLTGTRPVISPRTTASVTAVVRSGVFGPVSGGHNRRPAFLQGLNRAAHR